MKKALLIKIRSDKKIANQEYKCFLRLAKKAGVALDKLNVNHNNVDADEILNSYDAVIIGGSDLSVKAKFSQKSEIKKLIRQLVKSKKPFLGICFGLQLMVEALGGRVAKNGSGFQFGTKPVKLIGKEKIFSGMPGSISGQTANYWSVVKMPKNSVVFAKNHKIKCQGLKIKGTNIFGFQFHPELSAKDMKDRMKYYNSVKNSQYQFSKEDFKKIKSSKISEKIIVNFFKHIV